MLLKEIRQVWQWLAGGERFGDRRARLPELPRHILVRVVALLRELVQRLRLFERRQVLALEVLDETEMLELALIENLQRKDLTPFEESEALHGLAERCGYTHEDLARRLGKSRTSVTESLALNAMPDVVRNLCRLADISSKSLLLQVVRQDTPEKMTALIEKIASQGGTTRQQLRDAVAPKTGRPKHYVFAYRPATKTFNLKLSFSKSRVSRDEVIDALEGILRELRKAK